MLQTLLKINSKYTLKTIFSYLNYDLALKIIKKNKKLIVNLDISFTNYEKSSSYEFFERKKTIKKLHYIKSPSVLLIYIPSFIFTIIFFINNKFIKNYIYNKCLYFSLII